MGRIEIADIALVRPRLNVIFAADGRSNWAGLVERLARALGPNSNRSDPASSFSEIRMERGTIVFTDAAHNVVETLDDVEMALAWPSITVQSMMVCW